jgi:hypothetical protein
VHLQLVGRQDWMTPLDRTTIRRVMSAIVDGCILGAFSEEDGSVNA